MITNFGKILDPVADKLVQGTLALAVALRHPWMKVFFIVFLVKEIYMAVMMLVRGVTQVLGLSLSSALSASISGIAGIGHILTGVGIVLLLISLKKTV